MAVAESIEETAQLVQEAAQLVELLDQGNVDEARRVARTHLGHLQPGTLLTTTQAAKLLGVRSRNTLKVLVRQEGIEPIAHGNRMMLTLDDVMRLRKNPRVERIRMADALHEASADLGSDDGMSQEDMDILAESRPGRAPWTTR